MNDPSQPLRIHAAIIALVVIATTILGLDHDIDAQAVTAIFSAGLGFAGANATMHRGDHP